MSAVSLPVPLLAAALLSLAATQAHSIPSYTEVRASYRPSDTRILDRHGELIHRIRSDATVRRGQWTALADVSPALRTALILSEDKRFHEHSGVDWRAVSAAAWGNLWNSRTRGASTISMQLAGLLDGDWRAGPGGRSVTQKLGQAVAAQVLDRRWRKDEILEAYLNLVPMRGELVGVDAMSRTLFGKSPHGLDEREAAVAAALVRAPNAGVRQVSQRACQVLQQMQPAGQAARADCDGLDVFAEAAFRRRAFDADEGIAPHVARQAMRQYRAGSVPSSISTTLDARVQRHALQTLQRQLRELRARHVEDGAILVLDNASGEVLAWVGSSGELSDAQEVDAVTALRQPGSTLKPFLYAQAIAERRLTAASLLDDAPTHIPTAGGLYIPQNYDRQFKGWVSVRTALGASLNVPAVRTLALVTPDAFARQLRTLGLPLREGGDYYGYSLALGSAEVSLLSLTNAYRALANAGRHGPTSLLRRGPGVLPQDMRAEPADAQRMPSRQALSPLAAFIVGDILSDTNARARTFGTDSVLATRQWTAVKTGTSKDMRDNWAIGWSQHYTVGVWVGNASGSPMHEVSGTSGAAPVWAAMMSHLHATQRSRPPAPPAGLQHTHVQFADQLEAGREEWFMPGTVQSIVARQSPGPMSATAEAAARITAPASGTIIALDPDIPPARQRLGFSAEGRGGQWRIDGKPAGSGAQLSWAPWPGRHTVSLHDPRGQLLDEIRIEVRGAGLRHPDRCEQQGADRRAPRHAKHRPVHTSPACA